jgi:hypothetical protein
MCNQTQFSTLTESVSPLPEGADRQVRVAVDKIAFYGLDQNQFGGVRSSRLNMAAGNTLHVEETPEEIAKLIKEINQ